MMNIFKRVIVVLTLIIIVVCTAFGISGYKMYKNALNEMPLTDKVASIRQKENYATIEEVPQIYKDAVISVEDHRFYKHNGIDVIAIGRAVVNDIKALEFVEGGSTITQQLAKNIFFTQGKCFDSYCIFPFQSLECTLQTLKCTYQTLERTSQSLVQKIPLWKKSFS